MKIGIIDADLLGRDKHRFPNLVCKKISAYWKEKGADVHLLSNYNELKKYVSDMPPYTILIMRNIIHLLMIINHMNVRLSKTVSGSMSQRLKAVLPVFLMKIRLVPLSEVVFLF